MATDHPTFGDLSITQEEWKWVADLIEEVHRDIQQEARRARFAKILFQWDLAVRQFRKIEQRRLLLQKPTEIDLKCHALCLHLLLAIGQALVLDAKRFPGAELEELGVKREEIEAYVEELAQSLREWHHGFTQSEVELARERLFGAKT